jgi:hypothetical protein
MACLCLYCHVLGLACLMGSRFRGWVYWHLFTVTVNYYSSQQISNAEVSIHSSSRSATDSASLESLISTWIHESTCGPHRRHHVEQFLCCPVGCHGNLVFDTCYLVTTSSLLYVVTGTWFPSRCSTTDVWLWLHYSGFQPSRHNMLDLTNHVRDTCKYWGCYFSWCFSFLSRKDCPVFLRLGQPSLPSRAGMRTASHSTAKAQSWPDKWLLHLSAVHTDL